MNLPFASSCLYVMVLVLFLRLGCKQPAGCMLSLDAQTMGTLPCTLAIVLILPGVADTMSSHWNKCRSAQESGAG